MNVYLFKLAVRSLIRRKAVALLIIWCLAISIAALTYLFSLLSNNYNDLKASYPAGVHKVYIEVSPAMKLSDAISLRKKWETEEVIEQLYFTTFRTAFVSQLNQGYPLNLFGANQDYFRMILGQNIKIDRGQCVLTYSTSRKFGITEEDIAHNRNNYVMINNTSFQVVKITDEELERLYVTFEDYLTLFPSATTNRIVLDRFTEDITSVQADLAPYQLKISDQSKQRAYRQFYITFLTFAIFGVGLLLLAMLSILQLYNYKLLADEYKWRIYYILGALRRHVLHIVWVEFLILTVTSSVLALILCKLLYANIPNLNFEINLFVFFSLVLSMCTIMAIALIGSNRKLKEMQL